MEENLTASGNSSVSDLDYFSFGNENVYKPLFNSLLCTASSFGTAVNTIALLVISNTDFDKGFRHLFLVNQCLCGLVSSISMLGSAIASLSQATLSYCSTIQSEVVIFTGLVSAVYNIVCIAGEQYLTVVFPNRYLNYLSKVRTIKAIATTWIVAIILMLPEVIVVHSSCFFNLVEENAIAHEIYGYTILLCTFFIPVIIIWVAYGHMLYIIHSNPPPPQAEAEAEPGPSTSQSTNRVPVMTEEQMIIFRAFLVATVAFTVTWVPNQVYHTLYSIGLPLTFTDPLYRLTVVLLHINPCLNPMIYMYYEGTIALLKSRPRNQVDPKSLAASEKGQHQKRAQPHAQSATRATAVVELPPTDLTVSQTAPTSSGKQLLNKETQYKGQSRKRILRIQVQPRDETSTEF